jgi:GAF domain-containing protein
MNQRNKLFQNETQRYAIIGVIFGLAFPIAATLIRIAGADIPFDFSGVIIVQSTDPLLWIIDSAPFILGYVAMLAGRRQDSSHQREIELIQKESELIEIQNTLEIRVAERTKEIEIQSQRLRVAAEIAREAASSKNLSELLERAGQLIQNRFGFYHTGLFLFDPIREYVVLTASPTEAGRQMMINGHKLRVGHTGIVGQVASTGVSRVVLDTSQDAKHEHNPLLPNTRSEMALPLRVERDIIGVLDVQSDQPQAFTDDDVSVIQILADQLAATIERARLLQKVEQNLRDLEQAYGYTTRESWKSIAESGLINNAGYRFDNVRIQPINEVPESGHEALQSGNTVVQNEVGSENGFVAIPIKLRGQPIGVVTLKLKEGHKKATINTIEQAVDRLAGSLESARLFEEARHRADRELAISQMTTAISSAPGYDDILRATVEQVGKSLGDSEVSIQIISFSDSI